MSVSKVYRLENKGARLISVPLYKQIPVKLGNRVVNKTQYRKLRPGETYTLGTDLPAEERRYYKAFEKVDVLLKEEPVEPPADLPKEEPVEPPADLPKEEPVEPPADLQKQIEEMKSKNNLSQLVEKAKELGATEEDINGKTKAQVAEFIILHQK